MSTEKDAHMANARLPQRLSELLARRGDRAELARRTGLTRQMISRYCLGEVSPSGRTLSRLIEGLSDMYPYKRITADELLGLDMRNMARSR
ncbi:MAG: helix-turn-helix transcriptional regulator [Deltaproteobacteria bacterium]|nr:helix-turn-helix transcriptional regulator [Deltaproteobacteria bacterium]